MNCLLFGTCLALAASPADSPDATRIEKLWFEVQLLEWEGGTLWAPPADLQPTFTIDLPAQVRSGQTADGRFQAQTEWPEWHGETLAVTISAYLDRIGAGTRVILRPGRRELFGGISFGARRQAFAVILHRD